MKKHILSILLISFCLFSCNKSELEISKELENKLVSNAYAISPKKDKEYVVSTNIDTTIQRVATVALTKCLEQYHADYGTVLIMETNTGKIRSMVNLEKNERTFSSSFKNSPDPALEYEACRSVAQSGSASGLGPEGRRFESFRSDHFSQSRPYLSGSRAFFICP